MDGPEPRHTQVVGYDGSPGARAALDYALTGGPVMVVCAAHDQLRGREVLERLRNGDVIGADCELDVLDGPPARALARAARVRDADAIVVGSRGLGPVRGALGSVSQALLHETDVPVVVVPQSR